MLLRNSLLSGTPPKFAFGIRPARDAGRRVEALTAFFLMLGVVTKHRAPLDVGGPVE